MNDIVTQVKQVFSALIVIWLLQTLQYADCFAWGIQEYSRNYSISEIVRGMLGGFIEFSDNYTLIGEQVQDIARLIMALVWG